MAVKLQQKLNLANQTIEFQQLQLQAEQLKPQVVEAKLELSSKTKTYLRIWVRYGRAGRSRGLLVCEWLQDSPRVYWRMALQRSLLRRRAMRLAACSEARGRGRA
jgi:hypothetical protein